MSGQPDRLQWVDSAKGISIILVVMMYSVFNVGQDADGVGIFHYVIGFATPFRMPEFFLISGLFLNQVIGRTWRAFADRRVVHYFYFYALWAVIHLVLKIALGSGQPIEALREIAWATIEPYGVLWFIYLLAVFSATTKLLYELKAPHWAVLAVGAALQIGNVTAGGYLVEQFCHYFVFFYAGYVFAPKIFKLIEWVMDHAALATLGLLAWAAIEVALVFSPGYAVLPDRVDMGLAALPGLRLALALIGSVALCVTAALLGKLPFMDWLRWLGARSLIVYLIFVLPMSFTRVILIKLHFTQNVSVTSFVVMAIAIGFSLGLYGLVQWTGRGKFLFERPAWAHIPGTKGSRQAQSTANAVPAE
ncbi:MAG: acyltransferase [Hyphomicrobiales bacterium]|nr:acyltransferase [Hyphomicrobiales bacterium]